MTLSISTGQTQTIKKKFESTAGTSLQDLLGWSEDEHKASVSTQPPMLLVDPSIECSTIKTYSGLPHQEYLSTLYDEEVTLRVRDRPKSLHLPYVEHYGSANKLFGDYAEQSFDEPGLGNSIIAGASESLFRESDDQIFTNGSTCTLVRHKAFGWVQRARLHQDIKAVNVLFLNYEPDSGVVCSALTSTALDVEEVSQKQVKRRERLRAAYQAGMKALQLAEEAHVHAVNEEAKLGIDWDEWEDPS